MIDYLIASTIFGAPVIYCIIRVAGFKSRSKFLWGIFSILAPVPIFIILALLPSLRPQAGKDLNYFSLSSKYDLRGYVIFVAIALSLNGYFYLMLYSKPLLPVLQNPLIHVHAPLGLISYAAAFTTFVLLCTTKIDDYCSIRPILIRFQILTLVFSYLCIMSGAIWAREAWGRFWDWGPKETLSLMMVYIMVCSTTYLIRSTPNKIRWLLILGIQPFVVIFVFLIMPFIYRLDLHQPINIYFKY